MIKQLFEEAFRLWNSRTADERPSRGTPVFDHFRQKLEPEIRRIIRGLGFGQFTVKASVGMGNYAEIPWVGIRHDDVAQGFEQGEYVVYLFSSHFERLYLSINQGVSNLGVNQLRQRATELRDKVSRPKDFSNDIAYPLTRDQSPSSKPDKYQKGSIYTKTYELAQIPEDDQLIDDLHAALGSYQKFVSSSGANVSGSGTNECVFWKFSPGYKARLWNEFKERKIIAMGSWRQKLGSLNNYPTVEALQESFPELPRFPNPRNNPAHQLLRFKDEVKPGDVIVAYGNKSIYGFGIIREGDIYQFDDKEEVEWWGRSTPGKQHWRNVAWSKIFDTPLLISNEQALYKDLRQNDTIHKIDPRLYDRLQELMGEGIQVTSPEVTQTRIANEIYDRIWQLLQVKKQVILYGPPGTGKTWLAKKFVEEYHRRNAPSTKKPAPPEEIVLTDFPGFTVDSFEFFKNLKENNSKEWMHAHRDDFRKNVDTPLRTITKTVGEYVKRIDTNFETKPDSLNTISRINKNIYGQKDVDLYHTHMWSAFYRKKIGDKRKDAQLFIVISQDNLRFGFGFGNHKEAREIEAKFKRNATEELDFLFETLGNLGILKDFGFRHHDEHGAPHLSKVKTKLELQEWLGKDNIDIIRVFNRDSLPPQGNAQATEIVRALQTLYPIYLFATDENPREKVEDYLEGVDEEDPAALVKQLVKFVSFHQSYSYEEFIEGIRPDLGGKEEGEPRYKLVEGVFKKICSKARENEENAYFLIIDEINRGNISKIFGELITCLEKDKRLGPGNIEQENTFPVDLPYSKESLFVPWNLYVIGTMNTADKSIALVDVALRRRFGFLEVPPDVSLVKPITVSGIEIKLPEILDSLNEKISILIDQDHRIGHSYLMNIERSPEGQNITDSSMIIENLKLSFYNEIFPLILEYFYNDWEKIQFLLGDFVEVEKTLEDAQEMVDDANQGIYSIKRLDGEDFLQALNSLTESGKLAE